VALFVDAASGDLLRFSCKAFEENPMFANVQIQVAGGGGGDDEEEAPAVADKEDLPSVDGPMKWKKGLPVKKPGKTESVTTFRADFKQLGLAEAPPLDDKMKTLLRPK
jgi:hypothetical protein